MRDSEHASSWRPRRRQSRAARALAGAGVRAGARIDPGRYPHAWSRATRFSLPGVGLVLSVLDVPGHTAGHIACVGRLDASPAVFCGDTLFTGGCGRLFEGTPAQMLDSLSKLAALPARHARLLRARIHALEPSLRASGRTGQCRAAAAAGARAGEARSGRTDRAIDDCGGARDQSVPAGGRARRARGCGTACRAPRSPIRVAVFAEVRAWKNAF